MKKSNQIDYPVFREIEKRKSIRAFTNKPIGQDEINSLFEAARWSFSSSNEQGWAYIYATQNQPLWNDLLSCLAESNQEWCKHAPLLILTLAKKYTSREKPYRYNFHDVGASSMLMALQAINMGFQLHPMAGFDGEKVRELFNIPNEFEAVTMLAGGYHSDDVSYLKEHQQKAEKERSERFAQSEFVLNNKF